MEERTKSSHSPTLDQISIETDESTVSKRRLLLSLLVIFGVSVTWVSATQLNKYTLVIDPANFNAPYFMLWFNTAWMTTCFPAFLIYNLFRRTNIKESFKESAPILGGSVLLGFGRVLLFLVLWSGANYSYTLALTMVSASIATSISSCNAAFVWILAMLLLGDKFMLPKLLAVFFAIGGVVLISLDGQIDSAWLGIVLAVVSAGLTAIYKVLFKYILGDATLGQVSLFMTCLGLMNIALNAIPTFMLIGFKVEYLDVKTLPWWALIGSAALGLLFNFLINFGIALLHPLVISVGMLVGIPLNTVIDILFSQVSATVLFICGSACIVFSFILVVFPYSLVPFCKKIPYFAVE